MGIKDHEARIATLESAGPGGAATALATTGADVVISGAAPPVAGQVLTATSAVAATWQTPGAGGGITEARAGARVLYGV